MTEEAKVEGKTDEGVKTSTAEGGVDKGLEGLEAKVKGWITDGLAEAAKPRDDEPEPMRPAVSGSEPVDPWGPFIDSYVAPKLNAVAVQAAAAADAATFYPATQEAQKHRDKIEKKFQEQIKIGRPTSRADIWRWLTGRGGDLHDTIMNEEVERRAAKEKQADEAIVAGPGSARGTARTKAPSEMSKAELEGALKDVAF